MVVEADVTAWYRSRALVDREEAGAREGGRFAAGQTPKPPSAAAAAGLAEIGTGSMAGFFPPADLYEYLANLTRIYPDAAGPMFAFGCSLEGRVMYGIRISTMPVGPSFPFPTLPATPSVVQPTWGCSNLDFRSSAPDGRARVSLTGLIHAREPASAHNLLHFAATLLERKAQPDVAYILATREIILLPVLNPDGYAENARVNPLGGGMKRKNARPTTQKTRGPNGVVTEAPCSSQGIGVDLNRNFGFKWGFDEIGSSPVPCSDQYRGPVAFSEPETRAYKAFMMSAKPLLNLNYHSYLNMLLYPYGYATGAYAEGEDRALFLEYADEMTRYNRFVTGTGWGVQDLYPTNGEADDWTYGEQRIRSMTCELGSLDDMFWPVPSRILPLAEEAYYQNYALVARAGPVLNATGLSLRVNPEGAAELTFFVTNTGLADAPQGFTAEVVSAVGLVARGNWASAYPIKARSTDPLAASIPVVLSESAVAPGSNRTAVTVSGTIRFTLGGFHMHTSFQGRASLCPAACGQRARCNLLTAACECLAEWQGPDCINPVLPPTSIPRPSSTKASAANIYPLAPALVLIGVLALQ